MSKHIPTQNILFKDISKRLFFIDNKNESAINQNYERFNALEQKK